MYPVSTPARVYAKGIGEAVADRTVNRKVTREVTPYFKDIELPRRDDMALDQEVAAWCKSNGLVHDSYTVVHGDGDVVQIVASITHEIRTEVWADVAHRVATGNTMLHPADAEFEFKAMHHHLRQASILMSGRHLQHGDETQPERNMEVFTNCSTSAMSFLEFYLLLNGSGVGRAYDDAIMLVDYNDMPIVVPVIDMFHKDVQSGEISLLDRRAALHIYAGKDVHMFEVPDSREGWAKAIEKMDVMTFKKSFKDSVLIMDFSQVRPRGSPIKGMQNRPASGPGPLIDAIKQTAVLRNAGMAPWRAAMYADHYFAQCVLVGGARRAARMATKTWRDKTVIDFINIKRPLEFLGKTGPEIEEIKKTSFPQGFLWSSNNSVTVDDQFWNCVRHVNSAIGKPYPGDDVGAWLKDSVKRRLITELDAHAYVVFQALCEASYYDGTGEPGIISQDKLTQNDEGFDGYLDGKFAESSRYKMDDDTLELSSALAGAVKSMKCTQITNPCVTADTWIQTSEGPRQVAELVDKPFVALVDGHGYSATGFWKTGDKPVFKVKTNRGYEVRATANHKILVETSRKRKGNGVAGFHVAQEWVEVKDLEPGDKVVISNHRDFPMGGVDEFDSGWLLGEVVGDGGHNPDKYPSYVRFWGDNQTAMASRAAAITGTTVVANAINKTSQVSSIKIEELASGLITPAAKTLLPALEKKSAGFVAGFLRGLFDADGSVQGDLEKGVSVRLWQADERRIKTVQRMLNRLGIASTVYLFREPLAEREMPDGNGGLKSYLCSAGHELVISKDNVRQFMKCVGFYDEFKMARLEEITGARTRSPYQERFTTDVVSVERDGFEAVYDCTVDEVHRFDANGIVVHNCGEITLNMLGAYCVIADVVPFHAAASGGWSIRDGNMEVWDADAEDAFKVATRALIRTNLMDCLYSREVKRTNRIGVGITGFHEWVWARFDYGWKDIVNENKSKDMWLTLSRFKRAIVSAAYEYSTALGVTVPHTDTTIKPAGTTSKLFGLTEGAHLPSMREYLRWVQFRNDDPLIEVYRAKGYPVRVLKSYSGTTIVGFPTQPAICGLGMGDKLVTAAEATPEEQYQYLMLLEKYWLRGVEEDGITPLVETGNQVSYTLKYDPVVVDFATFRRTLLNGQSQIRCCSVMPQSDSSAYEYQPEEPTTRARYESIMSAIKDDATKEDIGFEHVDCGSGACPISFNEGVIA